MMRYVRFDTAANAIRHAIETLPPLVLKGAVLQVDDGRYDYKLIRELYDK
jgi:hypothetical protein